MSYSWLSVFFQFFKKLLIILLIITGTKVFAMDDSKETTRYILKMSTRNCAANIYINDLDIVSIDSDGPLSAGVGIGEYLKPQNNILKLEVWDPTKKDGMWRENAKCEIYIQGYDQVKELKVETVTRINFYPTSQSDLSKSQELFNHIEPIENQLGRSLSAPEITYSPESQHYTIVREFDVIDGYIEWPWYNSLELSAPFSTEQMEQLSKAYKELWFALHNKDLNRVRMLYKESISESSMSNHYDEDFYFNSMDFQSDFENEEYKDFVLIPLDISQKEFLFSLNNKVVQLSPSPLRFQHKNDESQFIEYNPKFRFDGKKFVITR